MKRRAALAAATLALLVAGCDQSNDFVTRNAVQEDPEGRISSGLSAEIRSDTYVPNAWVSLIADLIEQNAVAPPVGARTLGYASITLYEAVAQGNPRMPSLQGQLNGFGGVPQPEPGKAYVWPLVANIAMHFVVSDLFNENMARGGFVPMAVLRHQIQDHYQAFAPDQETFQRSIAHGEALGRSVTAWALRDGFRQFKDCQYNGPKDANHWVETAPDFDEALEPCFGRLRPMVAGTRDACQPPPPPAFSDDRSSPLGREMMEVYETVNNLTPNELAIAEFWADDPGVSPTPAGHFFEVARELINQRELGVEDAVVVYARLGVALSDSFVSVWKTKYQYHTIRPITWIRRYVQGDWETAIITPPFPDYTSGHSVNAAAATTAMESFFGNIGFTDNTYSKLNLPPRRFNTFSEAADESAISRIYGGVHYRASIDEGLKQGRCVGQKVAAAIRLQ